MRRVFNVEIQSSKEISLILGPGIPQLKGRASCAENQTLDGWVLYLSHRPCDNAVRLNLQALQKKKKQPGLRWCNSQELPPPQLRSYWETGIGNSFPGSLQFPHRQSLTQTLQTKPKHSIQGAHPSIQNRKWAAGNWSSSLLQQNLA